MMSFLHDLKQQWQKKKTHQQMDQLLHVDASPFQSLLPYYAYDEARQFFINDSTVGFAYELGMLSGANEEVVNKLISFVNSVVPDEERYFLQFIRWSNNKVGQQLDAIKKETSVLGGIYAELAQHADEYARYAALESFPNPNRLPICLRDNRLFLFISREVGSKRLEDICDDMSRLRLEVESDFKSNAYSFRSVDVKEFLSVMRGIVNPDMDNLYYDDAHDYSDNNPIKEQIKAPNFELRVRKKHLSIEMDSAFNPNETVQTEVSCFTINRYPQQFALWQHADTFANLWKPNQTITGSFLFSVTFCVESYANSLKVAKDNFARFDRDSKNALRKLHPSYGKAAQEWDVIRQEVEEDKRRLIYCAPIFVLFSPKDKHQEQVSQAVSCFGSNGFQLVNRRYIQLRLFLSALPFVASEGTWADLKFLGIGNLKRSNEVVSILPLVGDFKVAKSGVILPTFRHQLACFYPFASELMVDNRNIAVAGGSGGGKSFLVQAMTIATLSMRGKAWIIDKGQSYRKLCETMGGVYIDVRNVSLNPFSNVTHIDSESGSIRDLIAVMASPSGELTDVQLAHLLSAVNKAWDRFGNLATIDAVVAALQEINEVQRDMRIADMMTLLYKYTTKGQYGKYFNEPSKFDPNATFTVLELGGFEKNDELLRPVLFSLILNIQEQMFNSPRDIFKLCILDEVWSLLQGENAQAKRFIAAGYRTARKHGGAFCAISQGLMDFLRSPEAEALWENSSIKIVLKQQDPSSLKLKRNDIELLSPQEQIIARSFMSAKSGFSSILIKSGDHTSFNRLFVDPYKRILLSTDGAQFQAVENLRAQGIPIWQAVIQVAERYFGAEIAMIQKRLEKIKRYQTKTQKPLEEESVYESEYQ